jgi:hypothetical protein
MRMGGGERWDIKEGGGGGGVVVVLWSVDESEIIKSI